MTIFGGRFDQFGDVLSRGVLTWGRFDCNPEKHDILIDCQLGFRAKLSYETQILYLSWTGWIPRQKDTDRPGDPWLQLRFWPCTSKALTEEYASLWDTWQRLPVDSFIPQSENTASFSGGPVIRESTCDRWRPSRLGVRTSSIFLFFINDIPVNINWKAWMFADDFIVYREIKSNQDQLILKEDLDTHAEWERKWGMDLHTQKCNVLRVSRAKSTLIFSYRLKGTVLVEEATSKYLGVDLQHNLQVITSAWKQSYKKGKQHAQISMP